MDKKTVRNPHLEGLQVGGIHPEDHLHALSSQLFGAFEAPLRSAQELEQPPQARFRMKSAWISMSLIDFK